MVEETRKYSLVFWSGWFDQYICGEHVRVFVILASDMLTFSANFFSFVLPIFMIIFGRISQIFNSQFKALSQVHWLSYIKIFCLKFPCYWQQISKNTSSYNQVDNQFKIINKFKKRLCFGWNFIIVMDNIIIFFHYKKWIIYRHKKFFKNMYFLYSFTPSSSADILNFMF